MSRSRAAIPVIAVAAAMAVLGPLTAIAVGANGGGGSGGSGGVGLPAATSTTTTGTTTTGTGTTTTGTTTTGTGTTTTPAVPAPAPAVIPVPKNNPFDGHAMWIWELPSSDGGNITKIIAEAKAADVKTLIIKSGDGPDVWSQFSASLVKEIHAAGLKVCGWQFVYGAQPVDEAEVGEAAVKDGADCLVIDAETQYQGRYIAAQTYMSTLRAAVGAKFPLALAGFPYVSYHPSFPYSVFLGAGGAQYNVPQMYWQDIGTTVPDVYAVTYAWNEIYQRPIYPLGQMFDSPPISQVEQFNEYARLYKSGGVSWWVWQDASQSDFDAIDALATPPVGFTPDRSAVIISRGAEGDFVIWAQEHLAAWAAQHETGSLKTLAIDGDFGPDTEAVVEAFQTAHDIPASGQIGGYTWNQLLKVTPVTVKWVRTKSGVTATVARARVARAGGVESLTVPASAKLHAKRNELHGEPGRGGRG